MAQTVEELTARLKAAEQDVLRAQALGQRRMEGTAQMRVSQLRTQLMEMQPAPRPDLTGKMTLFPGPTSIDRHQARAAYAITYGLDEAIQLDGRESLWEDVATYVTNHCQFTLTIGEIALVADVMRHCT